MTCNLKGSFPTAESAFKVLYMAVYQQQEKFNKRVKLQIILKCI